MPSPSDDEAQLRQSALWNMSDEVAGYLSKGVDVNACSSTGNTALHLAATLS